MPVARGRQPSGTPWTSSGTSGRSSTVTRVPPGASSSVNSTRDGTPVVPSSQRKRRRRSVSTSSITPSRLSPLHHATRSGAPSSGSSSTSSASHSRSSPGSVSSSHARSRSTGNTISRRTVDNGASCNSTVAHRLACAIQRLHKGGSMPLIPMVIQPDPRGERSFDIYSRLLNERIVFLGSAVDDEVANVVNAQLLHLEAADPEKEIQLYINCPGRRGLRGTGD